MLQLPQSFSRHTDLDGNRVDKEACDSSTCPLPSMYQYFTEDERSDALSRADVDASSVNINRLGGFSDSMDHVPVRYFI